MNNMNQMNYTSLTYQMTTMKLLQRKGTKHNLVSNSVSLVNKTWQSWLNSIKPRRFSFRFFLLVVVT